MALWLMLYVVQWQQHVSYTIEARLDTNTHALHALEHITYINNSPATIETLYFHLYANAFQDEHTVYAREAIRMGDHAIRTARMEELGSLRIEHCISGSDTLEFIVEGTLLEIPCATPVQSGDSITLELVYYLDIPKQFSRLGFYADHYEMVQWYPKVCVFDAHGWHLDTYHAIGEFYGEFGNFDVTLDVPGTYVVAATGERVDPEDIAFIDDLITNDTTIAMGERKKVRFHAENVHDFAWVCDPDFLVERYEIDSTTIYVFSLKQYVKRWRTAGTYAVDAVQRYNAWYGMYPYKSLSVVSGYFRDGMEYPNLVIIGVGDDRITRTFELTIAHEIAHQWFYGIVGNNELDEAWLDEGFATYSEVRYFEDKYGLRNSFLKLPFLPPLSTRYYYSLVYYVHQTNGIEKPVLTPPYEFLDTPYGYMNSAYSKPALFLLNLEGLYGKETFHRILKRYVSEYKFRHSSSDDFVRVCREEGRRDLTPLFSQVLTTTEFCDWAVHKVEPNRVELENNGTLMIPVDVFVQTNTGGSMFSIDATKRRQTISLPESSSRITRVIIDPYGYALEPDRWNNYYPMNISIKPLVSFPSYDSYQILYVPYLWYSRANGITMGIYMLGDQFADVDYIRGRDQWMVGSVYAFGSEHLYVRTSYQTPIIFRRGMRTRIVVRTSNANDETRLGAGYVVDIGIPLSKSYKIHMQSMLSYYRVLSLGMLDSTDWELGRNVVFENRCSYAYRSWCATAGLSYATTFIGGEWNYLKMTAELTNVIITPFPFSVRLYAGKIIGTAPVQEMLYLSGALRNNFLGNLIFDQQGYFSPQQHLHIPGDGNMRGYATMHIKSDELFCFHCEVPARAPLRLFGDIGYYGEVAADCGVRIVVGPLSLNVPLYTKTDEPWKLRWSLGL